MLRPRASGILLHPTSLPGPDGIGDLGAGADRFLDFLSDAKQSLWQVLPLGPTGAGDSPYAGTSAFAGNPLLISLERLGVHVSTVDADSSHVDFGQVGERKTAELRRAFDLSKSRRGDRAALERFRNEHAGWLDDYALFVAIKEAHGGASWTEWPIELVRRDQAALKKFSEKHSDSVAFHRFVQFAFFEQWRRVREDANSRGIRVIGDLPIFVAHDSADVWANQELFHLDEHGQPTVVAGVPPDYFSPTGQLWGNPIYRWDRMESTGYRWWIERFRQVFHMVDAARIDHFRGFVAHWSVPAGEPTAENGQWEPGPGKKLFQAIEEALGDEVGDASGALPIIAEDLGTITPDVYALRDELGFPGMKILQFAFGDTAANPYLPHNYLPDCVVYTGTHDNDTTAGWYAALSDMEQHRVRTYLGSSSANISWDLIRLALSSVADTAIIPLQDVLALGSDARMNTPGRGLGNWGWRFDPRLMTDDVAARLADLTSLYGRVPGEIPPDEVPPDE